MTNRDLVYDLVYFLIGCATGSLIMYIVAISSFIGIK